MVRATIARHLGTYVLFILLVAVATAIGVAITAQETATVGAVGAGVRSSSSRFCSPIAPTIRGRYLRRTSQAGPSANGSVGKRGSMARMKKKSRHGLMPSGNAANASTVTSC